MLQGRTQVFIKDSFGIFPSLKRKLEHRLDQNYFHIINLSHQSHYQLCEYDFLLIVDTHLSSGFKSRNTYLTTNTHHIFDLIIYKEKESEPLDTATPFYQCQLKHCKIEEITDRILWAHQFHSPQKTRSVISVDELPVPAIKMDPTGEILAINQLAREVFVNPEQPNLKNISIRDHIEKVTDFEGNTISESDLSITQSIRERKSVQGIQRIVHLKNKVKRYLHINSSPIFENDKIKYLLVTFDNIEASYNYFNELQKFKEAIDSSLSAMVLTNLEGKVNFANKTMLQLWGYEHETDVTNKYLTDLLLDEQKVKEIITDVQKFQIVNAELNAIKIDRSIFPTDLTLNIVNDSNQEPKHILAWFIDTSEKEKAKTDYKTHLSNQKIVSELASNYVYSILINGNNELTLEWVSGAFEHITGYSVEEMSLLDNQFDSLLYHEDVNIFKDIDINTLQSDNYKLVYRIVTKTGDVKWIEDIFNINRKKSNNHTANILGSVRDITLEKEVQYALQQSEKQNRKLIESIPLAVLVHSKGIISYVNPAVTKLFGGTENDYLSKPILDMVHPDFKEVVAERMKKLYLEETVSPLREKLIDLYGNSIEAEINAIPILFNQQNSSLVVVRDVTEQQKFENRLKLERDKAENYLNTAGSIILILNIDHTIKLINRKGCDVLGSYREAILGLDWFTHFIPKNEQQNQLTLFERFITHKAWKEEHLEYANFESFIVTKKGEKRIIRWTNSLINDEYGNIAGVIQAGEDITEIKAYEKQLIEAKNYAEEAGKLKTAFLANMSHEIRTPMNGILGFTQMLRDPRLEHNKMEGYIEIIHKSSQQLLSIINDIVDISKIESGQVEIYPEPLKIHTLINELESFFQPNAKSRNIDLIIAKERSDDELQFTTDPVRLKQILINLISNAIKFTKEGYVKFGYKIRQGFIVFFVEDTGIGIDTANQKLIFDRFRQVEMEATRNFGGTGLGLSISKALVEKLNGKIWITSNLSEGSIFYVALPFVTKDKTNPLQDLLTSDTDTDIHLEGKTILIAEDEDVNFMYMQELLRPTKATIIRAENGKIAVKEATTQHIDLILMDIKMPLMDGYEAARKIKSTGLKTPIIAQTAYAMSGDKPKALSAGCDEYLSKPIKKVDLIKILQFYLLDKNS